MHATSSYRGNRATHTPTHRQDRLQHTAQQLARSVIINWQTKTEDVLIITSTNAEHFRVRQQTILTNDGLCIDSDWEHNKLWRESSFGNCKYDEVCNIAEATYKQVVKT